MKIVLLIATLTTATFFANAQDTTRLSMLFAGDIMGHGTQIASAYDPVAKAYDYTSCFQFIKPYIESADLALGNLEVTLAGSPTPATRSSARPMPWPIRCAIWFRCPGYR